MKWSQKLSLTRPGTLLVALVLVLAAGWAHRAFFSSDGVFSDSTDSHRTVVIGLTERPSEPGELHGTLIKGEPVNEAREAEVLSDRDCAPDADGVSHCLNELDLGARQITVRHHHRMGEVPCLRPGEIVTVVGAETFEDRGSA
ncbi:hypothetical protein [Salinibacter sp.]|jgi:hypothetical protein|uniref:hypothetical protein n=1 Tax=Salinibacter sp. TaxID=2065818 RepID=UPI0021E76262|nr:hypothetical protein [Salinibacter sp.]